MNLFLISFVDKGKTYRLDFFHTRRKGVLEIFVICFYALPHRQMSGKNWDQAFISDNITMI